MLQDVGSVQLPLIIQNKHKQILSLKALFSIDIITMQQHTYTFSMKKQVISAKIRKAQEGTKVSLLEEA